MGARAEHDLWGQALAIENQHGDRGPDVLAERVRKLREAGDPAEADFWLEVAACLNDLHAIRLDGRAIKKPSAPSVTRRSSNFSGIPAIRD
ncbi:DUF6961 family protein [Sphingopyxis sp.]|uniref:DUF6961 family protein n=1 Tax=Sphingopyxis sp. TaxID=1908224 RepID=UPI002D769237|nr:hypothetical protein [Sphingopyxis sp.]HET6526854.1 hypothetical protein [Sphingopyxis sp.]